MGGTRWEATTGMHTNSAYLVMPRGKGFVELPVFEEGYEALKGATGAFRTVTPNTLASAVYDKPISLIGLRGMLGFMPPEWAHFAALHTGVEITQEAARSLDRSPKELRGCRP